MQEAVQRLRVSRTASSEPLAVFWRGYGRQWALEEAAFDDLSRVAAIVESAQGKDDAASASQVVAEFREIWRNGFADPSDAYGWNEMNDGLPDAALLAFARGAHDAWLEVKDKL